MEDGPTNRSEVREEDIQYSVQSGSVGRQAALRGHQEAPWSTEYSTSTSEKKYNCHCQTEVFLPQLLFINSFSCIMWCLTALELTEAGCRFLADEQCCKLDEGGLCHHDVWCLCQSVAIMACKDTRYYCWVLKPLLHPCTFRVLPLSPCHFYPCHACPAC